jgi:lactobin A/cerein 7B family class IIb bacteriocin
MKTGQTMTSDFVPLSVMDTGAGSRLLTDSEMDDVNGGILPILLGIGYALGGGVVVAAVGTAIAYGISRVVGH